MTRDEMFAALSALRKIGRDGIEVMYFHEFAPYVMSKVDVFTMTKLVEQERWRFEEFTKEQRAAYAKVMSDAVHWWKQLHLDMGIDLDNESSESLNAESVDELPKTDIISVDFVNRLRTA